MEVEILTVDNITYRIGQHVDYNDWIYAEIQYLYDDGYAQIKLNGRVRLVDVTLLSTY
jgi:hypothetical protein